MPIHSYRCHDCTKEFDLLVGVVREDAKKECPSCASKKIERIITASHVGIRISEGSGPSCTTGTCCPTCNLG